MDHNLVARLVLPWLDFSGIFKAATISKDWRDSCTAIGDRLWPAAWNGLRRKISSSTLQACGISPGIIQLLQTGSATSPANTHTTAAKNVSPERSSLAALGDITAAMRCIVMCHHGITQLFGQLVVTSAYHPLFRQLINASLHQLTDFCDIISDQTGHNAVDGTPVPAPRAYFARELYSQLKFQQAVTAWAAILRGETAENYSYNITEPHLEDGFVALNVALAPEVAPHLVHAALDVLAVQIQMALLRSPAAKDHTTAPFTHTAAEERAIVQNMLTCEDVDARCAADWDALMRYFHNPCSDTMPSLGAQNPAMAAPYTKEIASQMSLADIITAVNTVFVDRHGFNGNTAAYHIVDNSLLHRVLLTRRGLPISLSLIYDTIVRRAGIPYFTVLPFPGHVVVGARKGLGEDATVIDVFEHADVIPNATERFNAATDSFFSLPSSRLREVLWRRALNNIDALGRESYDARLTIATSTLAPCFTPDEDIGMNHWRLCVTLQRYDCYLGLRRALHQGTELTGPKRRPMASQLAAAFKLTDQIDFVAQVAEEMASTYHHGFWREAVALAPSSPRHLHTMSLLRRLESSLGTGHLAEVFQQCCAPSAATDSAVGVRDILGAWMVELPPELFTPTGRAEALLAPLPFSHVVSTASDVSDTKSIIRVGSSVSSGYGESLVVNANPHLSPPVTSVLFPGLASVPGGSTGMVVLLKREADGLRSVPVRLSPLASQQATAATVSSSHTPSAAAGFGHIPVVIVASSAACESSTADYYTTFEHQLCGRYFVAAEATGCSVGPPTVTRFIPTLEAFTAAISKV